MLSGWKGSLQNSPFETSVEQRQQRSTAEAGKQIKEKRLKGVSNMKVKKWKRAATVIDYKIRHGKFNNTFNTIFINLIMYSNLMYILKII